MTDKDIFTRAVARKWRAPYRMAVGEAPVCEVADAVITALAYDLRHGGLPYLAEVVAIVRTVLLGDPIDDALAQLSSTVRAARGDLHVRLAVAAAQRLVVEIAQGDSLTTTCESAITSRFCHELIEYRLRAHLRVDLANETGYSTAQIGRWGQEFHECADERVAQIARRLLDDPSGATVRAPHARRERLSTEQLLEMAL